MQSGSTTDALVAIHHTICTMLSNNQFVRVFALDFSKAFDCIKHENFLSGFGHCTRFGNDISEIPEITASIVQGSSLGPAAYVATAADMRPQRDDNVIIKYADDTYLIVSSDKIRYSMRRLRGLVSALRETVSN